MSPLRLEAQEGARNFFVWCEEYAKLCKVDRMWEIAMMVVWQAWNMRNKWVFEKRKEDLGRVCSKMLTYLGEFEAATVRGQHQLERGAVPNATWKPPQSTLYKLNTDAAVPKVGAIGLGMIVRDGIGDVMMSGGRNIEGNMGALQAEAEGVRFGMKLAFEAGLRSIEMESDCSLLIDMLQGKRKEVTAAQVVVNDIVSLASSFDNCIFSFARRTCNVVAHSIAKAALHFEEPLVFMEECPPNLYHLVLADKTLL